MWLVVPVLDREPGKSPLFGRLISDLCQTQLWISDEIGMQPLCHIYCGFQAGDRITAMNGVEFKDKEKLGKVDAKRKPGARFKFTVLRNGKQMEIAVTLGRFPDDIIARAVGHHMLEHITPPENGEKTAKKERS